MMASNHRAALAGLLLETRRDAILDFRRLERLVVQTAFAEILRAFRGMHVGIDDARQYHPPAEIDLCG